MFAAINTMTSCITPLYYLFNFFKCFNFNWLFIAFEKNSKYFYKPLKKTSLNIVFGQGRQLNILHHFACAYIGDKIRKIVCCFLVKLYFPWECLYGDSRKMWTIFSKVNFLIKDFISPFFMRTIIWSEIQKTDRHSSNSVQFLCQLTLLFLVYGRGFKKLFHPIRIFCLNRAVSKLVQKRIWFRKWSKKFYNAIHF